MIFSIEIVRNRFFRLITYNLKKMIFTVVNILVAIIFFLLFEKLGSFFEKVRNQYFFHLIQLIIDNLLYTSQEVLNKI